ncbi:MAG TPA: ATP-dependent helicase [Frankiaceae bacterium]|nr:ATP-dependent helicase [Frankiaceae bacterium]
MTSDALDQLSPATRAWFTAAFSAPTPAQQGAWTAIAGGRHALVVAPTGSGKTLAAFLWALDRLASAPPPAEKLARCRVLYVSPLKALAVDIERNLRSPLAGIRHAATRLGLPEPAIRVGVRSGDTPADERRRLATAPPDILITTPESLFLLLTSQARESLRGVETVIVDEIHAVAGTKRGAHLAVCLERLDALLERPAQRIGLSATVRPASEVARFLGGQHPVDIVSPTGSKTVELRVEVTVEDMTAVGEVSAPAPEGPGAAAEGASAASAEARTSIWPSIERRVLELVRGAKSTIVFANSRRLAERLCSRLNELAEADALEQAGKDGEPVGPYPPLAPYPAEVPGQAGIGGTRSVPGSSFTEVARPHHGSMSREQRSEVEEALKSGRLPCVVATSSLELGIDMGAVDLVVQVESPPSVASGLQRVGRAGHQVGAASTGVVLPKHRGDLLPCAVVAERMAAGAIESLTITRNPLDVLAQHVVAMVSVEPWDALELLELVRRTAPYSGLPTSAYEGVLDMLAGRYPSDAFAELRPRLVWDRVEGTLTARPGAQRLAVTSGGTIPDRGLFGVYLVAGADGGGPGRRVGEFDEEMVYESRVGDVILLGSSSWRIEDIGADRVLVSPAPGQPGKLPFWHGDAPGRPIELGRAMGAFSRELSGLDEADAASRLAAAGLDDWAQGNLLAYLNEQREATGALPDDRTIIVERFRDELGDWRLAVHSPFGAQVHAPWALAVAARVRETTGLDAQVLHSDDGLILRLPDGDEPPSADLVLLAADDVEQIVQSEVGGSALFASRFRECAARALLLPRRDPTRRTPLWQQRQRAAQLLSVASVHPDFPIVLEAVRECLQDVFDVPGLVSLMRDLAGRAVRLVEVETPAPSPFARSLLFGYVGAFMYEGDSPLAERRAQALSLDSRLLAELLGSAELRELLDPDALGEIEAELQRLAPGRQARGVEGIADLLRVLGDLTEAEVGARLTPPESGTIPALLAELEKARRALRVRIAGEERWVAVEDAGRLRDALGVPMPVGVPDVFLEPVNDPFGDLISRFARTRGPFVAADAAARYGLGSSLVTAALDRLAAKGRILSGEFRPGGSGLEWCDAEVLRMLRRRSLAKLRREVEPVPLAALSRFLPDWLGTGKSARRGVDALARAIEQLAGAAIPASALETLVLPARVRDYTPAQLDELCASGEVVWAGAGSLPGNDGWVRLVPAEAATLLLPPALETLTLGPPHDAILAALDGGQALFFRALADTAWGGSEPADDATLVAALWDLVWAGFVTNDTLAPMRVLLAGKAGGGRSAAVTPPRRRSRYARYGRPALPTRAGPPTAGGRWWRLPDREPAATRRLHAVAAALLDRHGVLTRGAVAAEQIPGGFSAVYPVLSAFEDAGRCRRGYFVEGLGAAQFAVPGAVDRMRALAAEAQRAEQEPAWSSPVPPSWEARDTQRAGARSPGLVLAATDPASPFGAALPWPDRGEEGGHRPGRKAGALVVMVEGELVMYVERGGKSLLTWSDDPDALAAAAEGLATAARAGALGRLSVERADGEHVFGADAVASALAGAGFRATPRGLRLRG